MLEHYKGIPNDWKGTGWFRRWINVDANLVGKVVGIGNWQTGSMEVYLNGKRQFALGKVGSEGEYIPGVHRVLRALVFDKQGLNPIVVRYSSYNIEYYKNDTFWGGFSLSFGDYGKLVESALDSTRERSIYQMFFISVPLAFAIVHLFLFLYDGKIKAGIYYAFFPLSFALFIYISLQRGFVEGCYSVAVLYRLTTFGLPARIITGCMAIIVDVPFIMIISVPTGHTLWKSRKSGLGGEWEIRTGFIFTSVLGFITMHRNFGIVPPVFGISGLYVYGVLGFIISMSASLVRDFFMTNKNLEKQLIL